MNDPKTGVAKLAII